MLQGKVHFVFALLCLLYSGTVTNANTIHPVFWASIIENFLLKQRFTVQKSGLKTGVKMCQ